MAARPAQSQPQEQQQQQQQIGPASIGPAPLSTAQAKPGTTTTTSDGAVKHASSITISPATSNQNLKFAGRFNQTFWAASLRSAFRNHAEFDAVFEAGWGGGGSRRQHNRTKSSGAKIVALSSPEDFRAAERGEMKSADAAAAGDALAEFALTEIPTVTSEDEFPLTNTAATATTANSHLALLTGTAAATRTGHAEFALTEASKGLVSVIMNAYNRHCSLVLSPDDVWLTILSQFCAYVNNNAEGLRSKIVAHEDQRELKAYSNGSLESADYPGMIKDLLGEIREKIKSPELADWFRPGFSTTTEKEEVCAAVTAMASLQAYFSYKMHLRCGIPSVTMLGTVADWKLMRKKVDRLLEFEVQGNPEGNVMELWVGYLRKVCDGFVESAENPGSAKTLEFWDKVLSNRGGGSGPDYITGWLSTFTCFGKDGKFIGNLKSEGEDFPLIDTQDICHNVVSCPVKIDDNGVERDGTLFVGQVAFEAYRGEGEDYPTVRPRNDWCMAVAVKE